LRRGTPLAFAPAALALLSFALSSPGTASAEGAPDDVPARGVRRVAQRGELVPLHASFLLPPRRKWTTARVAEGELPDALASARCPDDMANVDNRFCIDKWEASLVELLPGGGEQPWPAFDMVASDHPVRAVSRPHVYPQAYISGAQAARACAAAGKRLCAPIEWRKACVGPNQQKFGYGNQRVTGRCNDQGRSPMLRLFPQVARSWRLVGMAEMNDPRLNQLDGTLATTGSHEECTNEYGVYDMVGNLHEWTSDPNGTFQGGYYLDTHLNGDGCSYRTVAHEFTYHDYSTGFRCCASPEE
jgi:hypothetical protein